MGVVGSGCGFPKIEILDMFYPVGTVYETTNKDFQPSTAWGGTWELLPAGVALRQAGTGVDGSQGIGTKYGTDKETLTVPQIPDHWHYIPWDHQGAEGLDKGVLMRPGYGTHTTAYPYKYETMATGGGQPHNNVGPSYAINIWRRTA